jgi:hypothetical protein
MPSPSTSTRGTRFRALLGRLGILASDEQADALDTIDRHVRGLSDAPTLASPARTQAPLDEQTVTAPAAPADTGTGIIPSVRPSIAG